MLDYLSLESSTEFPAFFTIFYTVLLSFVLSSLIAFTHAKTSRYVVTPVEFLQSLILVSIVSATVMQAIGDSLARGLGMLGALAIIRYRVTLKTPRNMVFTFAALAAGIACGVYAFVIALTGTIGFCAFAFLLRFSPLSRASALLGMLKFAISTDASIAAVEAIISSHSDRFRKIKFQIGKPSKKEVSDITDKLADDPPYGAQVISFEYEVSFNDLEACKRMHRALAQTEQVSQLRITFENITENV